MKARVKVALNERTQQPSVNAPIRSYFQKGEEIEIVDMVNGQEYKGNSVWYELKNGSFVWSGGVEGVRSMHTPADASLQPNSPAVNELPDTGVDYVDLFKEITTHFTPSQPVKIALVDSGVYAQHLALSNARITRLEVQQLGMDDLRGHGTHLAGLIAGRLPGKLVGLFPEVELISIKALSESISGYTERDLATAINEAVKQGADIINLSLNASNPFDPLLLEAFTNAARQHVLIAAAAGGYRNGVLKVLFPARHPGIISVGTYQDAVGDNIGSLKGNAEVDYLLKAEKLWSTDIPANGTYSRRIGSSMATAMVSALLGRVLADKGFPKDASRQRSMTDELNKHLAGVDDNPTLLTKILKTK